MHCCGVLLCEVYYVIVLGLGIIVVFFVTSLQTRYSLGISCTSREFTVCGSIEKEKRTIRHCVFKSTQKRPGTKFHVIITQWTSNKNTK